MNMYAIRSALADSISVKEDSSVMQELFTRFSTPHELLGATVEELQTVKGISGSKAKQITSTLKLARALNTPKHDTYVIRSPKDAFDLMRYEVGHLMHEEFWIICCNTKNHVISKERISVGSLSAAIVHPRETYRRAIVKVSASIIAIHNHPSTDCTPSHEDIQLTKRLAEAGKILGVELLDHLVISTESYCSLKERGLM